MVGTGENDKYAYGVKTRQVEMARAGREGTNAFMYDSTGFNQSLNVPDIVSEVCRYLRSHDLYLRLQALYPTFDSTFNYNFYQIVESGNIELAGWVATRFTESNGFGFSKWHCLALTANNPAELAEMTKVNCRKKSTGNNMVVFGSWSHSN